MFQNFLWYINSISSNLHMKGKYNAIDRGEVSIAYCTNNIPVPAKVSFLAAGAEDVNGTRRLEM